MKIMFICTGNTCRSAMAEGILKKYAKAENLNVEVYSCRNIRRRWSKCNT